MFIYDTLKRLHTGDIVTNISLLIEKWTSDDTPKELEHWQNRFHLTAADIRDIHAALLGHMRSEIEKLFVFGIDEREQRDWEAPIETFISLLLPLNATADISERIRTEFYREEMRNRITYLWEKADALLPHRPIKEMEPEDVFDIDLAAGVSCPLDSCKAFQQYLYNHLSDGNLQKVSSARTPDPETVQKLLELEYDQCHFSPGDPEYSHLEKRYKELAARIDSECTVASPLGYNKGFTPWAVRNLIKYSVAIPKKEAAVHWDWHTYNMLKNAVNGKYNKLLFKQKISQRRTK